jgi:hypothetical protein
MPNIEPSANDVLQEIHSLLGQMHATGAMDEEGPRLTKLSEDLQAKRITPTAARTLLHNLANNRQDYH